MGYRGLAWDGSHQRAPHTPGEERAIFRVMPSTTSPPGMAFYRR